MSKTFSGRGCRDGSNCSICRKNKSDAVIDRLIDRRGQKKCGGLLLRTENVDPQKIVIKEKIRNANQ